AAPTKVRRERRSPLVLREEQAWRDEIAIIQAYVIALRKTGVLDTPMAKNLTEECRVLKDEAKRGTLAPPVYESERLGFILDRLRSRDSEAGSLVSWEVNDADVASAKLRIVSRRLCTRLIAALLDVQDSLLQIAKGHRSTPVAVHVAGSQGTITSVAHIMLGFADIFQHDVERLIDALTDSDESPLGSGGGVPGTLPLDRKTIAGELSFSAVTMNSLSGVLNGDGAAELAFDAHLVMGHVVQLAMICDTWVRKHGYLTIGEEGLRGLGPRSEHRPHVLPVMERTAASVRGHAEACMTLLTNPAPAPLIIEYWQELLNELMGESITAVERMARILDASTIHDQILRESVTHPMLFLRDAVEYFVMNGESLAIATDHARSVLQHVQQKKPLAKDEQEIVMGLIDAVQSLKRRESVGGPGPQTVGKQIVRLAASIARSRKLVPVLAKATRRDREVGAAAIERTHRT
ncbi:MAG: lyase family protein, partial [Candidatus Dormibacteria bacterium]